MAGRLRPNKRTQDAINELTAMILSRYPDAHFELARAHDDPRNYDLLVTVQTEDPDEVQDLVVERVVEMRVEESIPIHVLTFQRTRSA